MPALAKKLKKIQEERERPLWEGPSSSGPNGGITQSMLNQFLVCRERFRIRYVLGLQPPDDFNKAIEFGSLWHCAEEGLAAKDKDPWERLDNYLHELITRYPLKQADIIHWYEIVKLQFPIYVKHWAEHDDVRNRTPLLQEEVFNVPYTLPSGRTVNLRGKFDSVDLIDKGIWLQENKTKGDIDVEMLQRNLSFDLQTGFYLVALLEWHRTDSLGLQVPKGVSRVASLAGVRYNVIRRPLSGGKGSIKQKKNQTLEEFYEELAGIIQTASGPDWGTHPDDHFFFMRWKVDITPQDIETFKVQFLNPILEQLCDWYPMVTDGQDPFSVDQNGYYHHFRMPYGIYSPLLDGRTTELDEYLASGSTVGLRRADSLFKELK